MDLDYNSVFMDAMDWHWLCHRLQFNTERTAEFEKYFNCIAKWKSGLENEHERTLPYMILTFTNPSDASLFVLKYL